ncbi:MAG: ribosome-associated translation inhibitor RaiA [Clostridia bacterium]
MKIEISGKNYAIRNNLKEIITKKIEKLERYFGEDATAKIICKKEDRGNKLEITISNKGILYRSEILGDNMFENLDLALPKIERQILKQSKKKNDYFKNTAFDVPTFEFLTEKPLEIRHEVIKKKMFNLVPISEEEAKLRMEFLDHDFYVFLNEISQNVCILYKRHDDNLGLIECIK